MHLIAICQALVLLMLANGAPILGKRLLGRRWQYPLDGNRRWGDGRHLLGPSKTYRGIVFSLVACAMGAALLGLGPLVGVVAGAAAMAGDLISSFIKRRLAIEPSGRAVGLDQIPEALLPALALNGALQLSALDIAVVVGVFWLGSVVLSPLLYWFGLRDRPY